MALHDKSFFLKLLEDPRRALTADLQRQLHLTASDVDVVVELITASRGELTTRGANIWESWNSTGVGTRDWPTKCWPAY